MNLRCTILKICTGDSTQQCKEIRLLPLHSESASQSVLDRKCLAQLDLGLVGQHLLWQTGME